LFLEAKQALIALGWMSRFAGASRMEETLDSLGAAVVEL
jgi:hypothetical protein